MVVHICNPSTQVVESGNSEFEAILGYRVRPCHRNEGGKASVLQTVTSSSPPLSLVFP
jgi:hypothetical protein